MSARGFQVDAHNVVPVWEASPKLEVGARTIRKKIHDRFGDYLVPYPEVTLEPNKDGHDLPFATNDWDAALAKLQVGPPVMPSYHDKPSVVADKPSVVARPETKRPIPDMLF